MFEEDAYGVVKNRRQALSSTLWGARLMAHAKGSESEFTDLQGPGGPRSDSSPPVAASDINAPVYG